MQLQSRFPWRGKGEGAWPPREAAADALPPPDGARATGVRPMGTRGRRLARRGKGEGARPRREAAVAELRPQGDGDTGHCRFAQQRKREGARPPREAAVAMRGGGGQEAAAASLGEGRLRELGRGRQRWPRSSRAKEGEMRSLPSAAEGRGSLAEGVRPRELGRGRQQCPHAMEEDMKPLPSLGTGRERELGQGRQQWPRSTRAKEEDMRPLPLPRRQKGERERPREAGGRAPTAQRRGI